MKQEQYRGAKAKRVMQEQKNAEAEGLLLPVGEVQVRLSQAGAQLRAGVETARRNVHQLCCDDCRDAVIEAHDSAMQVAVEAALKALAGE